MSDPSQELSEEQKKEIEHSKEVLKKENERLANIREEKLQVHREFLAKYFKDNGLIQASIPHLKGNRLTTEIVLLFESDLKK